MAYKLFIDCNASYAGKTLLSSLLSSLNSQVVGYSRVLQSVATLIFN